MVKIKIDNKEFEAKPGEYVIDIAIRNGIKIPHYCYHPALSRPANCRICLIEVEKAPKPMPSCILQAQEGMIVYTNSEKAQQARRFVMEYMLLNHPIDCPICDKAGECSLQDFYFEYNAQLRRAPKERVRKRKVVDIGPTIILDSERCILCTRCIRFMDEVAKSPCLGIIEKGAHSELTVFDGRPFDNPYSLNTVDICPVGALTSKDFRFKQRVWFLNNTNSICNLCATGCNITIQHKNNQIYRIIPRHNEKVNGYFMCDYGRLTYKNIQNNTLDYSIINNKKTTNILEIVNFLNSLKKSQKILFVIGQNMTMEELLGVFLLIQKNLPSYFVYYDITDRGFLDSDYEDSYLISKDKNPNTAGLKLVAGKLPQDIVLNNRTLQITNYQFDNILILDEFFYLRRPNNMYEQNGNNQNTLEKLIKKFDDKVIYFSSLKNNYISKFYNVICTPNIYSKDGSFLNKNNTLQKFDAALYNKVAINLLEVFKILGLERASFEYIWDSAKNHFPQLQEIKNCTSTTISCKI